MRIVIPFMLACAPICLAATGVPDAPIAQAQENAAMQRLSYGDDDLQGLLYWPGATSSSPLFVFVHGGGWSRGDMRSTVDSSMLRHLQAQGFAVASVNYRLVPDATVEQQAGDVTASLAFLAQRSAQLGFDADRIALAGHSAGAHLVSLVGTDPQYGAAAGFEAENLRGVLALDGAGYDVPRQLEEAGPMLRQTYRNAFGTERGRQQALSPITHAAAPNAPEFLILHVDRRASREQSIALGEALTDGGTRAEIEAIPGRGMRGHREINRRLGEADYPATPIVDAWLERVLR